MKKMNRKAAKREVRALKADEKGTPKIYDRAAAVRSISARIRRPAEKVASILRSRDRLYVALGLLPTENMDSADLGGSRPYVLAPHESYTDLEWLFVMFDTRSEKITIGAVLYADRMFMGET